MLDTQLIGNEFILVKASDVRTRTVDWLWSNRVPRGEITLLEGDPGVGESMLTAALAAAVTSGRALPGDDPTEPGACVMASLEDHHGVVIKPRLEAAGADLGLTLFPDMHDIHQWARPLRLPEDLSRIDEMIQLTQARLLVIDPLMAVLGRDINSDRDQDVREALGPLAEIARPVGTAVVIVRHLNKAVGKSAIYRGGGSIGIGGLARSALMLSRHPHERDRIILTQTKSNLGARAKAIVMSISSEGGVGRVIFEGEEDLTSDDVLNEHAKSNPRVRPTRRMEVESWLKDILADGPMPAREIEALAREAGHAPQTVRRARERLKIKAERIGVREGAYWTWVLPGEEAQDVQFAQGAFQGEQHEHLGESEHLGTDDHAPEREDHPEKASNDSAGGEPHGSGRVAQPERVPRCSPRAQDVHVVHPAVLHDQREQVGRWAYGDSLSETAKLLVEHDNYPAPIGPDGGRCPDCTIAPAPGQSRCWPCRRRLE